MLLAIDAGNTNVVFAVLDDGGIVRKWRISTEERRTADEYMVWISQVMKLAGLSVDQVDAAVIASVVPPVVLQLVLLCRRYFECEPMVIGEAGVDLGIAVKIRNPDEVGADRLVNAVAASRLVGGPLIVIDFGTATTFDVIGATGDYLGGVICPGINLSLRALHEAAAKLPRIAPEMPVSNQVTGQSTIEAMQSGVFWGYIAMIEGLVARLKAEHDAAMKVVATGGLAKIFHGRTDAIDEVSHDLTIHGLRFIYDHNAG